MLSLPCSRQPKAQAPPTVARTREGELCLQHSTRKRSASSAVSSAKMAIGWGSTAGLRPPVTRQTRKGGGALRSHSCRVAPQRFPLGSAVDLAFDGADLVHPKPSCPTGLGRSSGVVALWKQAPPSSPRLTTCNARTRGLRVDSWLGLKAVLEDPLQVTKILFVLVASRGTLAADEVT